MSQFLNERFQINKFQYKLYGQNSINYDSIVFDLEEKHLYVSLEKNKIAKFFINEENNSLDFVMETKSDLQNIKRMKMS